MFRLDNVNVIIPSDLSVILEFKDEQDEPIDLTGIFIEYRFIDSNGHEYICTWDGPNYLGTNCVLLPADVVDQYNNQVQNKLKLMFENYTLRGRINCIEHTRTDDPDYQDNNYDEYGCTFYTGIKFVDNINCSCDDNCTC